MKKHDSGTTGTRRRTGFIRTVEIAVLVILAIGLLVELGLGPAATIAVKRKLTDLVETPSSVHRIRARPLMGWFGLHHVRIGQPAGFEGDDLLRLDQVTVDVRVASVLSRTFHVRSVDVDRLTLTVVRNADGELNLPRLAKSRPMEAEAETPTAGGGTGKREEARTTRAVRIDRLTAHRLDLRYVDASRGEDNPILLHLQDVHIDLRDMEWTLAADTPTGLLGRLRITGHFAHTDTSVAPFALLARFGTLSDAPPRLVAALGIAGFELDSADAAVPPGVVTALGGNVLDVAITVQMAPDLLNIEGLVASQGARLPLFVGGTPGAPQLDRGQALLGAFSRMGGAAGNLAGNVMGAGFEVGRGAVDAGVTAAKGVGSTVAGAGRGLLHTARSAATGDVRGVAEGVGESMGAIGRGAADTVMDTGSAMVGGMGAAGGAALGMDDTARWSEDKRERFETFWAPLEAFVEQAREPQPRGRPSQPRDE